MTEVLTHRQMQDGQWYELTPPSKVNGKEFPLVFCEFQVPKNPNEYVVRGVPRGGSEEESFVLRFTDRGVRITPIETPVPRPKLQVVK